jgi:O-antigen/teichoic acid export membrane protein
MVMAAFGSYGIIMSFAIASIIASVLGYLYFVPRLFEKGTFDRSSSDAKSEITGLKQIIKFSGHNYAAVGMKTLTAQIGVLIVGTQNFELAAFYGLSVLISNLVGGVLNAVSRALLPTATEEWTRGNKEGLARTLDTGIRLSMLISGIGFLVLVIQPSQILSLISEQYVEASDALRILVVSSIIYSLGAIITSMLNAANRASEVAKIGIVSSAITIALTFILTPILYIEGAAIALLAGSIASLAMSFTSLKRKENITISARSTLKPAAAMAAGVAVAFGTMVFAQNIAINLGAALATYFIVSVALRVTTRKEIRMIAAIMRKKRS